MRTRSRLNNLHGADSTVAGLGRGIPSGQDLKNWMPLRLTHERREEYPGRGQTRSGLRPAPAERAQRQRTLHGRHLDGANPLDLDAFGERGRATRTKVLYPV